MSYECRVFQVVLLEESLHVICDRIIVVSLVVRRFAVVSRVDGIYWPAEDARESTGKERLAATFLL